MADYDYQEQKQRIIEILDCKTDIDRRDFVPCDSNFTFENGIEAPVASIFVDIRDSSSFFKNNKKDIVSRIMRAFIGQVIRILRSDNNLRDIGIRGDCVFAIYSAKTCSELKEIFGCATYVNTFILMFNKILEEKGFPTFQIGIGLGYDPKELVIKAGEKGTGHKDYVWVGDAVIDASNCCNVANKSGLKTIVISHSYYEKIKSLKPNKDKELYYSNYFKRHYLNGELYYDCELVKTTFSDWIEEGMKD